MAVNITKLRMLTGAAVVVAAGASGFFMKYMGGDDQAASPSAIAVTQAIGNEAVPVTPTTPVVDIVTRADTPPVLVLPNIAPDMPQAPIPDAVTLASTEGTLTAPAVTEPAVTTAEPAPLIAECETGFTAMAAPGAMVELTLEAPCYKGQMVDIFHAGMRFSEEINANGLMQVSVPAMEEDAFFNALFTDGTTQSTDILMLTVSDYQRSALYWKGNAGFALYALENGAAYGSDGHVSAESPFAASRGVAGQGGFLTELGQNVDGYHSVVYSYPAMLMDTAPAPEISIEAQVQDNTCGTEIAATFMGNSVAGGLDTTPLIMAVPGCDAVGEFLVLKNLAQDLRIAAN